MNATNFKTENNSFRKLMGNGITYKIPRFQRDYSWDIEQWEDLWTDIMSTINEDKATSHYMGYLVLQSSDDKHFDVIDGQQRLTTITFIILSILSNIKKLISKNIDAKENSQRLNQIRDTYIGYLDPVTLISQSKLTLNRNNDNLFQNFLLPLEHLPQTRLRASEKLMKKAFFWFDKQVENFLDENKIKGNEGQILAKLCENISDNLFFTVITVTDELNAYKVLETLNSRGVRLSSTDLLKNYLFSILDKDSRNNLELSKLEERWENMVNKLQSEKFPDFLRIHWNSRHKFARHVDLFKTIRNNIKDKEAVFTLLKEMEEDLDYYIALTTPEISEWSQEDKDNALILRLLKVKQPFSLLLSAKRKFTSDEFSTILKAVLVISFRYNTIGVYSPNELEKVYNLVAEKISQEKITKLSDVWPYLKPIYISDERLKKDFCEKEIKTNDSRSKKLVKYILCSIEKHLSHTMLDYKNDSINIEHVLPQNAPYDWKGFSNDELNSFIYRLGNMTLLNSSLNRDIGNKEYKLKRKSYEKSNLKITEHLAQSYDDWSAENIISNQKWMANQASSIWMISQITP